MAPAPPPTVPADPNAPTQVKLLKPVVGQAVEDATGMVEIAQPGTVLTVPAKVAAGWVKRGLAKMWSDTIAKAEQDAAKAAADAKAKAEGLAAAVPA